MLMHNAQLLMMELSSREASITETTNKADTRQV